MAIFQEKNYQFDAWLTHTYPGRGLAAVDCEDGSDCGEAVDVVGSVEGVEADDEAALPLALHLHHVVHLLRDQQARRSRAPGEIHTVCVIPSVVIFCKAFLTCAAGRRADIAATVQPHW